MPISVYATPVIMRMIPAIAKPGVTLGVIGSCPGRMVAFQVLVRCEAEMWTPLLLNMAELSIEDVAVAWLIVEVWETTIEVEETELEVEFRAAADEIADPDASFAADVEVEVIEVIEVVGSSRLWMAYLSATASWEHKQRSNTARKFDRIAGSMVSYFELCKELINECGGELS